MPQLPARVASRVRWSMRALAVLVSLLCAAAAHAQIPETVDPARIPAYHVIAPGLAAAGQPATEVLPMLGAMGFRTILSLRTPAEDGPDERSVVEAQGLRYVSVPVTPAGFSLADVETIERVLDDPAAGPILFHCATSNRVGAAWAVVQARRGKSLDEALAAGREAGLKAGPMEDAVRRLLAAPRPNP
jgi:uncharacterized protein (TIGR01244 family)